MKKKNKGQKKELSIVDNLSKSIEQIGALSQSTEASYSRAVKMSQGWQNRVLRVDSILDSVTDDLQSMAEALSKQAHERVTWYQGQVLELENRGLWLAEKLEELSKGKRRLDIISDKKDLLDNINAIANSVNEKSDPVAGLGDDGMDYRALEETMFSVNALAELQEEEGKS